MADNNFSLSDLKAVMGGDGGILGGGGGTLLIVIILFLFMLRGGNVLGGGSAAPYIPVPVSSSSGDSVTQSDLNAALAAQTNAFNQQQILLSSANNNYEVAKLISDQNMAMVVQNNTNQINVIQGFNALATQISNQTNALGNKLDALGFAMEQCCCSVKTLIKDNQISDLTNQLNNANNIAVNAAQTQALLGAMGKWIANPAATTA